MIADQVTVTAIAEMAVGQPADIEVLKEKPGRRRTVRAHGPLGRVIIKTYATDRAAVVAGRVLALAAGPQEPIVPRVLHQDHDLRLVVLTEVPGRSLGHAVDRGLSNECWRAGAALARWHQFWEGRIPTVFRPHSPERELAILERWADELDAAMADRVTKTGQSLASDWGYRTVIHRDLYEEQVMLGPEVGLIDLDDAAAGPAELDVGNLLAHLDLRHPAKGWKAPGVLEAALLDGYEAGAGRLDPDLLERCRRLSMLRLACIHHVPQLARRAATT